MTVVELHPEELIDKELLGKLSAAERVRLDSHVATCTVCTLERLSRSAFRDAFVAEVNCASVSTIALVAVEAAELARCAPDVSCDRRTARAPAGRARRVPPRMRLAASIAAALLMACMAAAALPGVRHLCSALRSSAPIETPAKAALPLEPLATRSGPSGDAMQRGPGPEASPKVVPVKPSMVVRVAKHRRARSEALTSDRSAAAIFEEANEALRQEAYATARSLYEEIETRYGGSPEAQTALAILGRLALDAAQPVTALRYFEAYVAGGGGALIEETAVGRALALERLKRPREEASAWSSFLARYPASAHAAHARARLAVLGED